MQKAIHQNEWREGHIHTRARRGGGGLVVHRVFGCAGVIGLHGLGYLSFNVVRLSLFACDK